MRGLMISAADQAPEVGDFEEPAKSDGQEVVEVVAAAINPVDRVLAADPTKRFPRVVGMEGIGTLPDGQRVYFERSVAPFGSVAEKSLALIDNIVPLPEGLTNEAALTLGISGYAGWLPLEWKAQLQAGESVLVLGATGAQGQIAVQAAKLLGAGRVVAAGRDRETLETLKGRGADDIIVLEGDLSAAMKQAAPEQGYDVVIDCLYGEPFRALITSGGLHAGSRVVVLGASAGPEATISFREWQSMKGTTVAGYSSFFVPAETKRQTYDRMVEYALQGKLRVETESFPLEQAAEAWQRQASAPHRKIVVTMR